MAFPKQKPIIGLTVDYEGAGGYSSFPWYALRENYIRAVIKAGGVPVLLPHVTSLAEQYISQIQGLIITGGGFDINPSLYCEEMVHKTVTLKEDRTDFELAITKCAIENNIPTLGICGGQQLLNVALGGSLIQHIPDQVKNALAHEQPNPRDEPGHSVTITPGTLLHKIVGVTEMQVNSAHHQAVSKVPKTAIANAFSSDGVIEGIEVRQQAFCLGVQWHPEFEVDPNDIKIFRAFNNAANNYSK